MKKTYVGKGKTKDEAIADAKRQVLEEAKKEIAKAFKGLTIKIKI